MLTSELRAQVELGIVGLQAGDDGDLVCSHAGLLAGPSLHRLSQGDTTSSFCESWTYHHFLDPAKWASLIVQKVCS